MKPEPQPAISESDERFLSAFEACHFRADEFRHREHLRVAYIYLTLYPFDQALEKMEAGLRDLLRHLGAPSSQYHRTLTEAWLRAVHHFMGNSGPTSDFEHFLETAECLLNKEIMGTHYTPGVLSSEAARVAFVKPDLQPIPEHAG